MRRLKVVCPLLIQTQKWKSDDWLLYFPAVVIHSVCVRVRGQVSSSPFSLTQCTQQGMELLHSSSLLLSLQSCRANHLNSAIKANNMFHRQRRKQAGWLLVFVRNRQCDGAEGDFDFCIFSCMLLLQVQHVFLLKLCMSSRKFKVFYPV